MSRGTTKYKESKHIFLGMCMHAPLIIQKLEKAGITDIYVIDYEADVDMMEFYSVVLCSPEFARKTVGKSKKVVFHKILDRRMRLV